ncbi:hypothetical protein ACVC7V_10300 [Hydrogenophaga sp. A37]|uniref:hypothetical protein n=1 Tax=Hydrogenophaga sp. A37 TaxID=1945864 RepID=UPI00117A3EA6|nr:hypothetical protein [Hydrogenophaga sp. A37]
MNRLFKLVLATVGVSVLAACGGGSSEPADAYVGSWRSACFSYVGNDGNTYFKRVTNNLTKASPTSLNTTYSDTTAHSDPACNNVLGAISNPTGGTIQLGPKASFLGTEVDSISLAFPTGNEVGYMTASATQLFLVAEKPNITPSGWGVGSPHTRIEAKQAPASALIKSVGSNDGVAPAKSLSGYSSR